MERSGTAAPGRRAIAQRRPTEDDQVVLNGILFVLETGIPWEDLGAQQAVDFGIAYSIREFQVPSGAQIFQV